MGFVSTNLIGFFICAMVKLHGMNGVWTPIMNGIPNKDALMD